MRKVNGKLEPYDPVFDAEETIQEPAEPTLEERLEAVEAALLEQLLRGLDNV